MKTTVYVDVLFFINFSMDFITLWLSALITSRRRSAIRLSLAACVGGIYGILCVLLSLSTTATYLLSALISLAMCIIAFGFCSSFWGLLKQCGLIWGCGALLGGMMTALLSIGTNTPVNGVHGTKASLICAAAIIAVYFTARIIISAKSKKSVIVKARWKNREVSFSALCDSGNLMRDPLCKDPVIPVSKEITEKLCGKTISDSLLSMDTVILSENDICIRMFPHRTQSKNEILCGFVPERVTIINGKDKKSVKCILAPKNCKKDYFAGHAATVPVSLLP